VVDDDRSVRFVLATALRDAGYRVDGFESARAALTRCDRAARPTCCSPTCACPATTAWRCWTAEGRAAANCR
jgi:DNA-binding NtrC family response regulator